MQSITRCHKGGRHDLNDFRLKGLTSKIWSDRHKATLPINKDRGNPTKSNLAKTHANAKWALPCALGARSSVGRSVLAHAHILVSALLRPTRMRRRSRC